MHVSIENWHGLLTRQFRQSGCYNYYLLPLNIVLTVLFHLKPFQKYLRNENIKKEFSNLKVLI